MPRPLDAFDELAPGLWVADHALSVGGLALGTRTSIIRLNSGGLWVHSPGPLSDALRGQVEALGSPECLVAPNLMHHLYLADWIAAWPNARTFGPKGLAQRQSHLRIDEELSDEAPPAWRGEIQQVHTRGVPRMEETVFHHAATRTVLLTDLCFNMQHSDSWPTRMGMRLNSAWGRCTPTRLFKSFIKGPGELSTSVDRILEWDFDRLIVTHGDVIEAGGSKALREAYDFLKR